VTIAIDKSIPIPQNSNNSEFSETVKQMEVGDSVLLKTPREAKSFAQCLRNHGFKQVTRRLSNGLRVWKGEPLVKPEQ
jgi:hypothetical protein